MPETYAKGVLAEWSAADVDAIDKWPVCRVDVSEVSESIAAQPPLVNATTGFRCSRVTVDRRFGPDDMGKRERLERPLLLADEPSEALRIFRATASLPKQVLLAVDISAGTRALRVDRGCPGWLITAKAIVIVDIGDHVGHQVLYCEVICEADR